MTSHVCSVEGCAKTVRSRGYCTAHWRRWQRHGDPNGGGLQRGECARYAGEVVMVTEQDECLVWPYGGDGHGYGSIHIDGKHIRASRYVCILAHGEPYSPDLVAAHSCGNGSRGCVNKRHLRWATSLENSADMVEHGTSTRGVKCSKAKLTEKDVIRIRRLAKIGLANADLSSVFDVSREQIRRIKEGTTWAWLGNQATLATTEGSDND